MPKSVWTARRRRAFIITLAETGNVSEAARATKVSRGAAYALRNSYPEFSTLWDESLEAAVDSLELEARRRAVQGIDQPHFHQGKVTGMVRKYSDALLMFLLRAHRPGKYRERSETGKSGSEGESAFEGARDELRERLDRLDQPDDDPETSEEEDHN